MTYDLAEHGRSRRRLCTVLPHFRGVLKWLCIRNTSELGGRRLEEGETGVEGILTLGVPGLEEGGQIQAAGGSLRAARAAADLAGDDERAQAAFGQVVGGLDLGDAHELEELAAMAEETLG